ncbi:MAG: phospholipase D-like domain-containing protein, partial [Chloroflexota bacterium]
DDDTVSDIPADLIYTGALQNDPDAEVLTLYSETGQVIDTANGDGGSWPAGDNATKRTMERIDSLASDGPDNWCTNDGVTRNGLDAQGSPINGTPRARNSCYEPPLLSVADVVVAKSGPVTAQAGDLVTHHITLGNTGAATASRVLLTDTLPSALDFLTQTSLFTFTPLGGALLWEVGDLAPGATHRITTVARVSDAGEGAIANVVSATTVSSETDTLNNVAAHTTTLRARATVYLPLTLRRYAPPRYGVIIEAALYDGLQSYDYDEAVLVLNGLDVNVDLSGWRLCKWSVSDWRCAELPAIGIGPGQRLWLARKSTYFARSFGFAPDYELSTWPRFTNTGDEVVLLDAEGALRDVLVYGDGLTELDGWQGPAVQPYRGTNFALRGQILYRILDEGTGLPAADTDSAADWAQHDDPQYGRRVRYPGWDLERFFQPAVGATGTITAGIAPDNAYQLVVETIRSAEELIEMEAHTFDHHGLVLELVERANQGVSVTVLLEGGPVGGMEDQQLWACEQLHATGRGTCAFMINAPDLNISHRYTHLHAKFIVVDRERVLISSQNLNHSGLPGDDKSNGTGGSRGVVLVTDAPEMVARAVEVFEADCDPDNHADVTLWAYDNALGYGAPPAGFTPDPGRDWVTYTVRFPETMTAWGTWFELITAPEAALRSSDGLLGLVARAGGGDAVYVQQLYERADWGDPVSGPNLRLQAYVEAARRGASVRVLLNGGAFDLEYLPLTENVEAVARINAIAQDEGLDLSASLGDPTQYGIHNKMVLIDLGARGQHAHVGSINGSETSNKVNREMALQVRSTALFNYLHAMFDHDWSLRLP